MKYSIKLIDHLRGSPLIVIIKRNGFAVGVGTSRARDPKEALRRARSETTYRRITNNLTPWSDAT